MLFSLMVNEYMSEASKDSTMKSKNPMISRRSSPPREPAGLILVSTVRDNTKKNASKRNVETGVTDEPLAMRVAINAPTNTVKTVISLRRFIRFYP